MNTKLKARQAELAIEIDAMQTEAAEKRFEITFDNVKSIKTVQDHLNKGYTWKTQNAAVVVSLYDQFKTQGKSLTAESKPVISLRGHELNALYQALLNVEGTGIESARKFITMLTHVGETVSIAMTKLAEMNKEISELHQQVAELEGQIQGAEEVEAEVEPALDETSK